MCCNEVDVNIRCRMIILVLFHEILLIDQLDAQHVASMPMMQPHVEPAEATGVRLGMLACMLHVALTALRCRVPKQH